MEKHGLAKLIQGYAILNGCASIFLFFFLLAEFNGFLSIMVTAVCILVSVGMYTIGEVVQLLHEIRNNTANTAIVAPTGKTTISNSQLPKL